MNIRKGVISEIAEIKEQCDDHCKVCYPNEEIEQKILKRVSQLEESLQRSETCEIFFVSFLKDYVSTSLALRLRKQNRYRFLK